MPREIRDTIDLPPAVRSAQAAHAERRAARDDLLAQAGVALARLDAIGAQGAQYTPAQVRDAVVDVAKIVRRLARLLQAI